MDSGAHRVLEAAGGRLATIVEFSDGAIVCTDLCGIFDSWNRGGGERLLGYAAPR